WRPAAARTRPKSGGPDVADAVGWHHDDRSGIRPRCGRAPPLRGRRSGAGRQRAPARRLGRRGSRRGAGADRCQRSGEDHAAAGARGPARAHRGARARPRADPRRPRPHLPHRTRGSHRASADGTGPHRRRAPPIHRRHLGEPGRGSRRPGRAAARGALPRTARGPFPARALERSEPAGLARPDLRQARPGAAAGRARAAARPAPAGTGERRDPSPCPGGGRHRARDPQPPTARGARRGGARPRTRRMNDLTAVREVWASRTTARSRTDLLYLVYLVAMSVLVLGIPALSGAGQLLARPDVLPALGAAHAPQATTAATLAAAAIAVQAGAVRGPALMAPFLIATLASSGLRRRDVLRRPFGRALLVPVTALAVPAALAGTTLSAADLADAAGVALFVLAAAGTGLLLAAAWLAGQLLHRMPARLLLCALLLGAAVLSAIAPVGLGLGAA